MVDRATTGLRERKKQATRRHIAGTAVHLFLERGFDSVSIAEIAEAADVSKVTVFNYFPAKADMIFELPEAAGPDPAAVVRERPPGVAPLAAIRAYYIDALDRRLEWTCLHDGVEPFARMMWASPTLLAAFSERARQAESALALELARATGEQPWGTDESCEFPWNLSDLSPPESIAHRVVAAMIGSTISQLTFANITRMLAGQTTDEAEPSARTDAERAFDLLQHGIADYGITTKP
jgi:AcrR family transcriptional regulator